MSRSYRKHFIRKFGIKGEKHRARKRIRRYTGDIPDGCFYKKLSNQWDIIDMRYFMHSYKLNLKLIYFRLICHRVKKEPDLITIDELIDYINFIENNNDLFWWITK